MLAVSTVGLLLWWPGGAPAVGSGRVCRPVAFAPQSGELAGDIRAFGVGCAEARRVAARSRRYPITHTGAVHRYTYAGFRCLGRDVQPVAIEFVAFRCTRGREVVAFYRSGGTRFRALR
jgi:hypothetical protein